MSLLREAAERAERYLAGLGDRRVLPEPDRVRRLEAFLEAPLPEKGIPDATILARLDELGSPATVATAAGRYFGFVVGGSLPATVAAAWLATAWDQNANRRVVSPASAAIESAALRDLLAVLRLPAACEGAFVTGATTANLAALAAARHALLARSGWDVEARGLFGAPPFDVFVSAESHPSVHKALGMLGLGRERVRTLPVDDQGRIRPDGLGAIDAPALVCAQAGNVNSGACDPFEALADVVRRTGGWLHVDGAFGLWAAASPRHRALLAGIEGADSWATDAHKWLNVPYDSGVALVRDAAPLRAAFSFEAPYLPRDAAREPGDTTPEFSRRARGVEVWAALRSLGRAGAADLVERSCAHAQRFAGGLADAGFEILNDVVLNQVLVAFGDDATTERVVRAIQDEGTCWCGTTRWHGRTAMRISVSSWATTVEDVERSLAVMCSCALGLR
ncbi:MAG: pyridoxal-dependent decarboxylase [Myxococcota bacterium]|nr:pyridoxal-dependent decarboxylase [Myxococcota bacterium]